MSINAIQNPPTEAGMYWVIPSSKEWTQQEPCILEWDGNKWWDKEGWRFADVFRAISARLVPPETR